MHNRRNCLRLLAEELRGGWELARVDAAEHSAGDGAGRGFGSAGYS